MVVLISWPTGMRARRLQGRSQGQRPPPKNQIMGNIRNISQVNEGTNQKFNAATQSSRDLAGNEFKSGLSFRAMLWTLLGVTMLALVLLVGGNLAASQWVDHYTEQEKQAKDLVADILPPPAYLVEARLLISQAAEGSLAHRSVAAKLEALKKQYFERSQYWAERAPGELRERFKGEQHLAAVSFWDMVDQRLFPALALEHPFLPDNLVADLEEQYQRHRTAVDATVALAQKYEAQQNARVSKVHELGILAGVGGGSLTLVVLGCGGWWLSRKLWLQVGAEPRALAQVAKSIAEGDLTVKVDFHGPQSLARHLEAMRVQLTEVLSRTSSSSSEVSRASCEIAAGVQEVASRLEQDAATLQQTRAATAMLTQHAQTSHDKTRQASELALEVEQQAAQARHASEQASQSVTQAVSRSAEIENLVQAVKSLAFQTSILSLNAHIESARAGDAGKGFAVVAHEVRKLAQDTNEAANTINRTAEQIGADLSSAKVSATQALTRTDRLTLALEQLKSHVVEVTHAADESLCSLQECSAALSSLDQAVQQNAAFAEQSSAAAKSLSDSAVSLGQLTASFRV